MRYAEQDVTSSTSVHVVWCQGDDLVDPTPFTSNQSIVTTELTEGDHFFTGHAANLAGAVSSMLG
jgi:alpha/beta superfamily hydrolase